MADFNMEYTALCNTGKVREKNQDNIWCDSFYLESENNGLEKGLTVVTGIAPTSALCVFDGMGGEKQGEVAAYIAAKTFNNSYKNREIDDPQAFLTESCLEMNSKICQYQQSNHIRNMGTTAAILFCGIDEVYTCNLGDSRIYSFSEGELKQLSQDHVHIGYNSKKTPLTQSLGIPESEFIIEPFISKNEYRHNDRYLLCSDGLTDMVSDEDIAGIFSKGLSVRETAETLMSMALENGGIDNTTIIICELRNAQLGAQSSEIKEDRDNTCSKCSKPITEKVQFCNNCADSKAKAENKKRNKWLIASSIAVVAAIAAIVIFIFAAYK